MYKDQPRLMGQSEYVIPLIFLPEGRDANLMGLEYCILNYFSSGATAPNGPGSPHSRGF
jgi:hypothetical protein